MSVVISPSAIISDESYRVFEPDDSPIVITAAPTNAPAAPVIPEECPYQDCIDGCIATYGGDGTSGPSYMCSKGCSGMSGGAITNPYKYCDIAEAERYDTCLTKCESASGNESNREICRYGCEF